MSKERLEDKIVEFRQLLALGHVNMGVLNKAHEIHELVIKKAERVQELEDENDILRQSINDVSGAAGFMLKKSEQQNKRYREALEFYADEATYKSAISIEAPHILYDYGSVAREALEGEV